MCLHSYDDLASIGHVACDWGVSQIVCGACSLQLVHSNFIPFRHHDRLLAHRCGALYEGGDGVRPEAVHSG